MKAFLSKSRSNCDAFNFPLISCGSCKFHWISAYLLNRSIVFWIGVIFGNLNWIYSKSENASQLKRFFYSFQKVVFKLLLRENNGIQFYFKYLGVFRQQFFNENMVWQILEDGTDDCYKEFFEIDYTDLYVLASSELKK